MVTLLFASLLTFLYIFLTFMVIRGRRKNQIPYGYGPNNEVAGLVSAHSNFASYVPIFLILFYLIEHHSSLPQFVLILFGCAFSIGRMLHIFGLTQSERGKTPSFKVRTIAMITTISSLVALSIIALASVARHFFQ